MGGDSAFLVPSHAMGGDMGGTGGGNESTTPDKKVNQNATEIDLNRKLMARVLENFGCFLDFIAFLLINCMKNGKNIQKISNTRAEGARLRKFSEPCEGTGKTWGQPWGATGK